MVQNIDRFEFNLVFSIRMRLFFLFLLAGLLVSTLSIQAQVTYPGAYSAHTVRKNMVQVQVADVRVVFTFYRPSVVRVDFLPASAARPDSSYAVVQSPDSSIAVAVANTSQTLTLTTSGLTVVCTKNPFRIRYTDAAGRTLLADAPQGGFGYYPGTIGGVTYKTRLLNLSLQPNEHIYGTGERAIDLDLRGQRLSFQNQSPGFYGSSQPNMNTTVPFFASSAGYGLFIDNPWWNDANIGAGVSSEFLFTASGGELTYYLMATPDIPGQLEAYTWLTGRQPVPPRWSLGYIQSKFGYRSEAEARSVVSQMRQERIPCDGLVLDLYWYNAMGDLSWYAPKWPDPAGMCRDFLAQGINTIAITESQMVNQSVNYNQAFTSGYFANNATSGSPAVFSNFWSCGFQAQPVAGSTCTASLLDFTNPRTGPWWWGKHTTAFGQGVAGIWTDLGEPDVAPPASRSFVMQYRRGPENQFANLHNLLWTKAVTEGFAQLRPDRRLFNLTRSGWAGQQRYGPVTWSGDVYKTFTGLELQLPVMLNMSMSGMAWHHADASGFYDPTPTVAKPELYARWMQFAAFSPIMRAHSYDTPAEPWAANNASVKDIVRAYIRLRYQLLPYRYALAHENNQTGMPIVRPLFFAYPAEDRLYTVRSAYLFGPSLLVAPVVTAGQTTQTVYLPTDDWVDYWTDQPLTGGQLVTVAAGPDRLPLFVRAGSLIPMQPLMDYTDQRPVDTLIVQTYPSLKPDLKTTFTVYDDDGQTLAYQRGQRATTQLAEQISSVAGTPVMSLSVSATAGSFVGKLPRRTYLWAVHQMAKKPSRLLRNGVLMPERASLATLRQQAEGYVYVPQTAMLYVQMLAQADSSYVISVADVQTGAAPPTITALTEPNDPAGLRAWPNPMTTRTGIRYQLAAASAVRLSVMDAVGREVNVLVDERQSAGPHQYGLTDKQIPVPGVYLVRLVTDTYSQTLRIVRTD